MSSSRWPSSFGKYAEATGNAHAKVLGETLDRATGTFLQREQVPGPQGRHDRQPRLATSTSRCTGPRSWPRQNDDAELAAAFAELAETLAENEQAITDELIAVQGRPADIGGYYRPDADKAAAVMRPSKTFNDALAALD